MSNYKLILEYIFLDANDNFRTKTKVFPTNNPVPNISDFPIWNYDGSSTNQAPSDGITEVLLKPIYYTKNPMLMDNRDAYIVFCECLNTYNKPIESNKSSEAMAIINKPENLKKEIWFGIEMEFFFISDENKLGPQGEYYCGLGQTNYSERKIMETLIEYCLICDIPISGFNQEVAPHQWEFQVGPIEAQDAAHSCYVARYILGRISEQYNKQISFHPKPIEGNYNGSGCHINISSWRTRADEGLTEIKKTMKIMENDHANFIENYCGKDNQLRLTGAHETSDPNVFTYSEGGRSSSIRIPTQVLTERCGYFEDRRPGSAINYYETLAKYVGYMN